MPPPLSSQASVFARSMLILILFTFDIMDATLPFHIEELVFRDQKLYISRNDTPQFLRLPFLADNVYSFTAFPNTMPGALPCLQTLSHRANFLLILFPSHSQLSVAEMFAELGKKGALLSFLTTLSFRLSLPHVLSYSCLNRKVRERLTVSSQPKAALCAHSTVKDNSNSGRTKEEGRGSVRKRDLSRETSMLWRKGL